MNISTDPWIPVLWTDGRTDSVSLCEAFQKSETIRDLALRPHERIAIMRLLICVAQAALNGPADHAEWKECRPQISPATDRYLNHWKTSFELFGHGKRFLQVDGLRPEKDGKDPNLVSKLDLMLATGHNSTLFDNAGGSERSFSPSQLALMLLTFQCFSPGGTIGKALWDDEKTSGQSGAPCIGMLHTFIRGANLLETIHFNLLSKESIPCGRDAWGKPVWESMPQKPPDKDEMQNATSTYLGRLVPLSRFICLGGDGRPWILANGLEYGKFSNWRESAATVVVSGKKREPLKPSIEKGIWRELHSLVVISKDKDSNGGPLALRNIPDNNAPFDIWAGGLAFDGAKAAKPVDTIESVFHVPGTMLHKPAQSRYEQGVQMAEIASNRLNHAISTYHRKIGDNLDRPEYKTRRLRIRQKATAQFWTDIEQAVRELLRIAANPEELGLQSDWTKTGWGRAVWKARDDAYKYACPRDTPRQMRAFVLGLNELHRSEEKRKKRKPNYGQIPKTRRRSG